jgi:hypothetical protein
MPGPMPHDAARRGPVRGAAPCGCGPGPMPHHAPGSGVSRWVVGRWDYYWLLGPLQGGTGTGVVVGGCMGEAGGCAVSAVCRP